MQAGLSSEILRPVAIPHSPALDKAFALAEGAHRGQQRKDGRTYIEHPTQVAQLLAELHAGDDLLVAAVLHDAVEDSELTVAELREEFGDPVAELVEALTEDEAIMSWERRKDELRARVQNAGAEAAAIYVADKVCNLREVVKLYAFHGEAVGELEKAPSLDLRIDAWRDDLEMGRRCGVPKGLCRYFEIELGSLELARRRNA